MLHIQSFLEKEVDVAVVHGLRPEIYPLIDMIKEYCKEHGLTHGYTVNTKARAELMQRKTDWSSVSAQT